MKHDWEYKKIKDITSLFTDGDWIESKDQSESGIRLIQTGNIGDGFYIGKEDRPHFISEETFERLKCTEIFEGDCLISRLPQPLGRSCLLPKLDCRAITAVDCSILRFKNICNPYYFVYYTQSFKYQNTVDINATGTTRKRISRKNLENIPIPLPPLSTQQSIVSELDSLSQIIADCKETLKDYDALEQSIFYDMFGDPVKNEKGWDVKKLGDCYKVTSSKRIYLEELTDNGIPFLKVADVNNLINGECKPTTFISDEKYNELKINGYVPKANDLIVTARGTIGNVYIVKKEDAFYFQDGMITWLKQSNYNTDAIFIKNMFLVPCFLNYLEQFSNNSTVAFLSISKLANVYIPVPPLALQQAFASKIEAIEQMKVETKKALQEAETLFQARMDYWFG